MNQAIGKVALMQQDTMYLNDPYQGGGGNYTLPLQPPAQITVLPAGTVTATHLQPPTPPTTPMPLNYDCNTPQCMTDMLFKETGLDASYSSSSPSGPAAAAQGAQPGQTLSPLTADAPVPAQEASTGGIGLVWLLLGGYLAIQLAKGTSRPKGGATPGGLGGVPKKKKQTKGKPKPNSGQRTSTKRRIVL